ncbi:hypothetical protein FRB95_012174 [Tulasnella sp. JGI-2019a]|nr:hypothetical protein FRB93_013483 [Tulasnella sp. JGI-2019a]KAG9035026.1 hypothetical protein FRB95_012174 [Tulasnella sp. JGI-2019a]
MATPPKTLERQFTPILGTGKYGLVSYPTNKNETFPDETPELVLIFGWMEARLPHIQKYTELYNKVYPGATQMVVRSYGDFLYTNSEQFFKEMAPLAKMLQEYQGKRVLVHVFSNGGCLMLTYLVEASRSLTAPEAPMEPLQASAIIFDSCPGTGDVRSGARAFTAGMKNPIAKYAFATLVIFVITTVRWFRIITGKGGDHFNAMRKQLLDPVILPHGVVPRTYIYSDSDAIIPYKAVESHAEESKHLGLKVEVEKFPDTPHVNHIKGESNLARYLDIIQKTWKQASSQP